jgi:hypothetical protein
MDYKTHIRLINPTLHLTHKSQIFPFQTNPQFFAKNAPELALKLACASTHLMLGQCRALSAAFAMHHERTHMPEKDKYYSEH